MSVRTTGARTAAVLLACVTGVGLAACGGGAEEPVGLGTESAAAPTDPRAGASDPAAEPTSTSAPGTGDEPAASPSFTQPYIPDDEPRVIDLPETLPVEPPDGGANDEQREVLDAAGRFMAAWQAVLFGADPDLAGVRDTSVGVQLDRLLTFSSDARDQEWVFTGEPMVLAARAVSVNGDTAEVDLCLVLPNWFEIRGGSVNPYGSPERYLLHMQRVDGAWKAANAVEQDAGVCG